METLFFKKHFCNDIITCWTNSIFWSSGCTNIDKFVTSFVKINGVSYSLPFFFATVFRNPVFTSWYVSLSPLFTLHVRVSFTSFRVFFFFAGFCIVTIVSKVRLRPEFKEMWALMKGLTESGETLLLGWCMEISGKTAGPRCHLFRWLNGD